VRFSVNEKARKQCLDCRNAVARESYARDSAMRERIRQTNARSYERHKDRHAVRNKANWQKVKTEVVAAYGGKCGCCGEDNLVFLTIDHVNNDGAAHRREVGRSGIYFWLRRKGYPEGFQVLCWNCNMAKALGGCPHQQAQFFVIGPQAVTTQ
jgi:hypothetical protein